MYFFKNYEPGRSKRPTALPGGSVVTLKNITHVLIESLTAEEKPGRLLLELGILVLLLHAWVLIHLLNPAEPVITPAEPLIMQISLIPAPESKPQVATPPQATQPHIAPKAAKPKKPLKAQKPPISRKTDAIRQTKQAAEAVQSEPKRASATSAATTTITAPTPAPAPKKEAFTEANYRANYEFNPKPNYPRIARSRGWQGKVLLRVQVSTAGKSDTVSVHKSSGHEILDESAIEAVKQWRFIPARRGDTPVASSVVVPILFTLQN